MKYMLMMHVGHDDGREVLTWAPQDITNMIEFQQAFDRELEENGEMVFNAGLSWPDQARIVRHDGGAPVVTAGPFPESKEFLIGSGSSTATARNGPTRSPRRPRRRPVPAGRRRACRSRCVHWPARRRWRPDPRSPGLPGRPIRGRSREHPLAATTTSRRVDGNVYIDVGLSHG